MDKAKQLIKTLETDGFVVFHDFFAPEVAARAQSEIAFYYQKDLDERKRKGVTKVSHEGTAGTSILTEPTHLMIDAYGKSPTLDQMFEKILTDSMSQAVLRALAGSNLKMRGYNIKKMTGNDDPKPTLGPAPNPHDWHRDSPGEICIAIFLDDFSKPDNGTTALMKGSHRFPNCPRWSCLFGPQYPLSWGFRFRSGISAFLRLNPINRCLARKVTPLVTGAYGKRGDFYIFINDVWHGREPNICGNSYMMLMAGAYPTEFPFPDEVKVPSAETLSVLPETMRTVVSQTLPPNSGNDTILHRMLAARKQAGVHGLFFWARVERKIAEFFSVLIIAARSCLKLIS